MPSGEHPFDDEMILIKNKNKNNNYFLSSFFLSLSSSGPNDGTQWWPVQAIVGHAGSLSSFIVLLVDSHLAYECFLLLLFIKLKAN